MLCSCKCASCGNELRCSTEGFDGKNVWITLTFTRHYKMCQECKNVEDTQYCLYFCGPQCFKDYVADPNAFDKYYEDDVMWGRMERCMKTGEAW